MYRALQKSLANGAEGSVKAGKNFRQPCESHKAEQEPSHRNAWQVGREKLCGGRARHS